MATPDARSVTVAYGTSGMPWTVTTNDGRVLTVTYDGAGREVTRTSPGTGTVTIGYDSVGHQTSREDELEHTMHFGYDEFGRMETYTDKLGNSVVYVYDEANRLVTQTNREDETVTWTYDAAGRRETGTGPGVDLEWAYDPLGRIVMSRSGDVVLTKTWDERGQTGETMTLGAMDPVVQAWEHDEAGRVTLNETPWGSQVYAYDAEGRLSEVDDDEVGAFTFGWNADDQQTSLTRPNGMVTTSTFDAAHRVTSIGTSAGAAVLDSLLYTYDGRGFPLTKQDDEGVHSYAHDAAGRLTEADHPPGSEIGDETYTYDAASRRTSWHGNGLSSVSYDDGDRILSDATWLYAWDEEGRRIGKTERPPTETGVPGAGWTYVWNALGQLVEVTDPESNSWEYTYDAENRRVRVVAPEGTSVVVYDGLLARAMLEADGDLVERYVTGFGFGEVLAEVLPGGEAAYLVRDSLGTAGTRVSEELLSTDRVRRESFGRRGEATLRLSVYDFTGHAADSLGLIWGRSRYYDPDVGQWVSEDRDFGELRYNYSGCGPTYRLDPSGNSFVDSTKMYVTACARAMWATKWNTLASAVIGTAVYESIYYMENGTLDPAKWIAVAVGSSIAGSVITGCVPSGNQISGPTGGPSTGPGPSPNPLPGPSPSPTPGPAPRPPLPKSNLDPAEPNPNIFPGR
jgi:RHS repeat-associated protein